MNLAKYVVALEAQSKQYVSELQKANKTLSTFHRQQTTALDGIKKGLITLGAAFSVRMVAGFVRGQIEAADETLALSKRLGVTTEALSELQYAAKLSNVDFQTLTMSMQFLAKNVSAAAANTGMARPALQALHLEAKKLTDLPLDKQLEVVSDALAGVTNQSDRVRYALALFGKSGAAILQMAGDIGTLRTEAARLGVTLTEEMAVRGDQAADSMDRLGFMLKALGRDAALSLAPLITGLTNVKGEFGGFGSTFDNWVTNLAKGMGFVMDAWRGWELLIKGSKMVILDFETVTLQILAKITRALATAQEALAKGFIAVLKFGQKFDPLGIGKALGGDMMQGLAEGMITGSSQAADTLDAMVASFGQDAGDIRKEFELLAAQPMPSLAITKSLEEARASATAATKAIKDAADAAASAAGGGGEESKINMKGMGKMGEAVDIQDWIDAQTTLNELAAQEGLNTQMLAFQKKKYYEEIAALAQDSANIELASRNQVFEGSIGLLSALGAEHRGAAIAALVLQKAMALKELFVNAATSKALIAQNTAVAVMKAYAQLGPIGGLAASAAIVAKGAAAVTAVTTSTAISAGLIVAQGVIEASQLSKGGTQSTRGTSANPIATTGGGAAGTAAGGAGTEGGGRGEKAVHVTIAGDIFGWDDYVERKVIGAIKSAVNGRDVVFISSQSRQGRELQKP